MASKRENKDKNISLEGRMLPNSFEAEQAVLGSALIDSEAALAVISRLSEDDFYNETHRQIFSAIKKLYSDMKPIDFVTVSGELDRVGKLEYVGGMSYISMLSNYVPSSASCNHYIDIVRRTSILRQIIKVSGDLIKSAYTDGADEKIIGEAEKYIYDIAEQGKTGDLEKINDALSDVINKFDEIHKDNTVLHGLKTGFYQLDKVMNGLQKSDLIIIAARPGVGKTSLAMNIVSNAAIDSRAKCAVFSFEMGRDQLVQRVLCSVAGVSMERALRGQLNDSEWGKIWKAEKKLKDTEIYIDVNTNNTPSMVLHKCRKLKREKGLDLVVIDYIGLMKSDTKTSDRQNEVAEISRQLKMLAKELNVPVIVLSQLNRSVEKRPDGKPGRPVLSDLRESGQIEQDADIVMFIHRDMSPKDIKENENKDYTAEIIIAKFRNGQTGSVFLGWDGSRTSFVNLEAAANMQSLEKQYESLQNQKRSKKTETGDSSRTSEDFKNSIDGIINHISPADYEGFEPEFAPVDDSDVPPEEESAIDYSDVEIPSDDELF